MRLVVRLLIPSLILHAVSSLSGSGKTHSMLGEVEENSEKNGIIPRAVDHIFSFIRSQHADAPIDDEEAALNAKIVSNTLGEVQFLISLSFLEIYKSDMQTHRPELGLAIFAPVHVFRLLDSSERLWATLFSLVHLSSLCVRLCDLCHAQ